MQKSLGIIYLSRVYQNTLVSIPYDSDIQLFVCVPSDILIFSLQLCIPKVVGA
jgi:hypothetical protein